MLKRLIYSLAIVIATFALEPVSAQTHYRSNVSIGVKGGADLSRVFFNPKVKQDFLPGAMAGLMFRYVEESHFGIVAELNMLQHGWKENFEGAPYRYSRTMEYLELPILAHIYFGHRGKFFVNVGPEFGVRLSDHTKCNFETSKASTLEDWPTYHNTLQYDEALKGRFDYGIAAGVGGEFGITPRHSLNLEVRFYYGLGNLFGAGRKDNFNASNTMALEFTLGYWFRIK